MSSDSRYETTEPNKTQAIVTIGCGGTGIQVVKTNNRRFPGERELSLVIDNDPSSLAGMNGQALLISPTLNMKGIPDDALGAMKKHPETFPHAYRIYQTLGDNIKQAHNLNHGARTIRSVGQFLYRLRRSEFVEHFAEIQDRYEKRFGDPNPKPVLVTSMGGGAGSSSALECAIDVKNMTGIPATLIGLLPFAYAKANSRNAADDILGNAMGAIIDAARAAERGYLDYVILVGKSNTKGVMLDNIDEAIETLADVTASYTMSFHRCLQRMLVDKASRQRMMRGVPAKLPMLVDHFGELPSELSDRILTVEPNGKSSSDPRNLFDGRRGDRDEAGSSPRNPR